MTEIARSSASAQQHAERLAGRHAAACLDRRPRAKDDLRDQARKLRLAGSTYRRDRAGSCGCQRARSRCGYEISRHLTAPDIPPTTLDAWDVPTRTRRSDAAMPPASRRSRGSRAGGSCLGRELLLVGAAPTGPRGPSDKPWRPRECLTVHQQRRPTDRALSGVPPTCMGVADERRSYRVSIHESADVMRRPGVLGAVVDVPVDRFLRADA